MELNDIISRAAPNSEVTLPSGEFEGPLVINKPLRIRGKSTTIWAKKMPVIQITSGGVTIEDIRAEITEGSVEDAAVITNAACGVKNVEVLGRVSGFGAEDGYFDVPRTIELGRFPSDRENTYRLAVNVPEKTEIVCELREVKLEPAMLAPGRNEITIRVNGISAQTLLYAEVLFKSRFTRRVYLSGRPDAAAPQAVLKQIYTAPERSVMHTPAAESAPQGGSRQMSEAAIETAAQAIKEMMRTPAPTPAAPTPPAPAPQPTAPSAPQTPTAPTAPTTHTATDVIPFAGRQNPTLETLDMKRGQRVGLAQYLGNEFEVWFTANAPRGMEIDPYVFLLESGDRAIGDDGLVFFGNERSPNGEVKFFPGDGHVSVDLSKVPPRIQKIALAYSIYDGGTAKNFRSVISPRVSLRAGGERVTFTIDGLTDEATIVALEFYLYKGEWKISAVGAGFKDGLAKLCNRYGIEVE